MPRKVFNNTWPYFYPPPMGSPDESPKGTTKKTKIKNPKKASDHALPLLYSVNHVYNGHPITKATNIIHFIIKTPLKKAPFLERPFLIIFQQRKPLDHRQALLFWRRIRPFLRIALPPPTLDRQYSQNAL